MITVDQKDPTTLYLDNVTTFDVSLERYKDTVNLLLVDVETVAKKHGIPMPTTEELNLITKTWDTYWGDEEERKEKSEESFNNSLKHYGLTRQNTSEDKDYKSQQAKATRIKSLDAKKPIIKAQIIQKYTTSDGILYEAVIVGGKPYFVTSNFDLIEKIQLPDDTILMPPKETQYLNKPYKFDSLEDIKKIADLSLDDVYQLVKNEVDLYVDRPSEQKTIYTADIILTYSQDKFATIHYLFNYGDNDSGKTSDTDVLESLMYRALKVSSATEANIFNFLGEVEEGQGTIIEDEADDIDRKEGKIRIYKVGCKKGAKIPRMDISNGREQHGYWAYGLKVFAAERQLDSPEAKGFNDRTFYMHCYPGTPKHYIKEILENAGDLDHERLKSDLQNVRNTLFAYRLKHQRDRFPDVKVNITNRNRELVISLIRLFQNTQILKTEILPTLSKLLTEKQGRKSESLEAVLFNIITGQLQLINSITLDDGIVEDKSFISSHDLWRMFKMNVEGEEDEYKKSTYYTADFGPITLRKIASLVTSRFGGKKEHTRDGNGFRFDLQELKRLAPNYENSKPISIEIIDKTTTLVN